MTKQDFLDGLRRSLSSGLDYQTVNEHIRYYTDYIDSQMRQGVPEEEVMNTLGDPRLIAKTLLGMEGTENVTEEYIEDDVNEQSNDRYFNINGKVFHMPEWLFTILVCGLVFFVLTMVFALVSHLLPVLLLIMACMFFYRFIRNLFM